MLHQLTQFTGLKLVNLGLEFSDSQPDVCQISIDELRKRENVLIPCRSQLCDTFNFFFMTAKVMLEHCDFAWDIHFQNCSGAVTPDEFKRDFSTTNYCAVAH
jgi:hypothetical protein